MNNNDVFVKLNLKNIGEVRSLIVDKDGLVDYHKEKYLMCAGKYDKNGWTIVFKAKDYKEAEYIIENTPMRMRANLMINNKAIVC
ncbi:hypothetical protein ACQPU1_16220 [Clostridium paraputrificum]|uniref:hypothetical protein n=1 Tax=Clostridium TaxID=1485 RepID=UPI003D330C5C